MKCDHCENKATMSITGSMKMVDRWCDLCWSRHVKGLRAFATARRDSTNPTERAAVEKR